MPAPIRKDEQVVDNDGQALEIVVSEFPKSSPEPTQGQLDLDLRALRGGDVEERLQAFDRLRTLPREAIEAGYERVRSRSPRVGYALDCLERLEVEIPDPPIICDICICTVVSPGYEPFLNTLLETLTRFGQSPEACVVVFAVDESFDALAAQTGIIRVRCHSLERLSPAVKGVVYSAARFVQARQFLALEVDMLVVDSLRPLWDLLGAVSPSSLLGARVQREGEPVSLRAILGWMGAPESDIEFLTGESNFDGAFWFNGGTLAGGRKAFLSLDSQMRRLCPWAILFVEGAFRFGFTDEFVMNACVGLMGIAAELSPGFNIQIYDLERERWLQTHYKTDGLRFNLGGEPARILHFTSPAREMLWQVKREIDQWGVAP